MSKDFYENIVVVMKGLVKSEFLNLIFENIDNAFAFSPHHENIIL